MRLAVELKSAFSAQADDTRKIGYILCVYVLGAIFIMVITGLSGTPEVSKLLHLSLGGEWQYMIAAVVTVGAIWWATEQDQ
jgi:TRAP-type mannitol/chloroaromatic compound transport system permease large subunit